jgi:hypothetical protein
MIIEITNTIIILAFTGFIITLFATSPKFTIWSGIHVLFLLFMYYVLLNRMNNIYLVGGFCITYMIIYVNTVIKQISDDTKEKRELDLSKVK